MVFERFVPPEIANARPKVTIRPSGLISFDAAAVACFGLDKATHAILFFDKSRKIIGVKPITKGDEKGSIKLSRRRRSMSLKSPQFFDDFGLTVNEPQSFDVRRKDGNGMLQIDATGIRRRRGRRPKRV